MDSLKSVVRLLLSAMFVAGTALAQSPPADLVSVCADALHANARYQAALAAYRAQQELVPQAEGKLLPQLAATGSYTYSDDSLDGSYFGPLQINNGAASFVELPIRRDDGYRRSVYGATLSQTVFDLDQFYGWPEADARVKQAYYELDVAQDELLVNVADAYFGLLLAQANQRLAQAKMNDLKQQSDQVRGRAGAGLALEADQKLSDAAYALAAADELSARNLATLRAAQLSALTGREYSAIRKLRDDVKLAPPAPQDEKAWTARALLQNPQVLARKAAQEAAAYQSKRASSKHYPRIDLVGGAWKSNSDGGIPFHGDETLSRIGVRLTLPLYSGGQVSSGVRQAEAAQQGADALLEDARRQAVLQTRMAFLSSAGGLEKVPALKHSVEATLAMIDATNGGYEAGTRSYADVLAAVQQRYAQESGYAAARYDFLIQTLKLKQASGTLVPAELARLNGLLEGAAAP